MLTVNDCTIPESLLDDALRHLHHGNLRVFTWFLVHGYIDGQNEFPHVNLFAIASSLASQYTTVTANVSQLVALGLLRVTGEGRERTYTLNLDWRAAP